jgi:hypothetical protein
MLTERPAAYGGRLYDPPAITAGRRPGSSKKNLTPNTVALPRSPDTCDGNGPASKGARLRDPPAMTTRSFTLLVRFQQPHISRFTPCSTTKIIGTLALLRPTCRNPKLSCAAPIQFSTTYSDIRSYCHPPLSVPAARLHQTSCGDNSPPSAPPIWLRLGRWIDSGVFELSL